MNVSKTIIKTEFVIEFLFLTKIQISALSMYRTNTPVDLSAYKGELDFCANPAAARQSLKTAITSFVNTILPPENNHGYLTFMTEIFCVLITFDKNGSGEEIKKFHTKRLKWFLECFFIAAVPGMKIPGSRQRNALGCITEQLMKLPGNRLDRATYESVLAAIRDSGKRT